MPIIHYSAWYPVLFLVLALAISLTVAIRRGLRTFRSFRAFSGSAEQALGGQLEGARAGRMLPSGHCGTAGGRGSAPAESAARDPPGRAAL